MNNPLRPWLRRAAQRAHAAWHAEQARARPAATDAAIGHQVALERQQQIALSLQYRHMAAAGHDLGFDEVGFNVHSSTGEDGILLYIFSLLRMSNRRCIDIGAAGLDGSNVANLLLHHGFEGLLLDADGESLERARGFYADHPETRLFAPSCVPARLTVDNVDPIVSEHGFAGELDLLCIDIDGVDYWIWQALGAARPRVVVVEYQDILGPERCWTVPYRHDFDVGAYAVNQQHYNYAGASLGAMVKLGRAKGYRLVGCNRGGYNAFFVREGLGESLLPTVSVQSCFRYSWNRFGMRERFPLVAEMDWVEV